MCTGSLRVDGSMNIFQDNLSRLALRHQDLATAVTSAAGGVLTIEPSAGLLQRVDQAGGFIVRTTHFVKLRPGPIPTQRPVNREKRLSWRG